ncbi:MAG TPA: ABC transporter ATP-binding protein [Terriglobales bacterium]|nr:ABC transporter ATP-binding protein [Terriglobales bacterium]
MPPIIEFHDISKEYVLGGAVRQQETLRELLMRKLRLAGQVEVEAAVKQRFWALRNVSFDVNEGEVIGIIGRNGAGKSTLLKILSRITDPTSGSIQIRGRLASLLEVGTGFHPELTGRENIFLNGAILGMRKTEIVSKFDEIVAFSEVEKFLDTPVKRYSSGMYVRLAFSVAAHLNPEILVVDEVLAVGDMAFQKKCLGKMSEVSQSGRTVIFVSHNMAAVQNLCHRGIVLSNGQLLFNGKAEDAIQQYLHSVAGTAAQGHVIDLLNAPRTAKKIRPKLLERMEFYTDGDISMAGTMPMGAGLKIRVHFSFPETVEDFDIGIGFDNAFGQRVFTAHSCFEPQRDGGTRVGPQTFICNIPSLTLVPGEYVLRVWVDLNRREADLVSEAARIQVIESDYYGTGRVPWNGVFVLKHHWYSERANGATS